MREREALARDGFILVNLYLDASRKQLAQEPEIITRGFVYLNDSKELLKDTRKQIESTLSQSNGNFKNDLEGQLRNFFYNETKRRPMIFVVVNES
jgi:ribonuclease J